MRILGLDLSLTSTGYALCVKDEPQQDYAGSISIKGKYIERNILIRDAVIEQVKKAQPDVIIIEGYAMGIKGGMTFTIGEMTGLVKEALWNWEKNFPNLKFPNVMIVAPSQLKKFTTGKGNADKLLMIQAVNARYDKNFLWVTKNSSKNEDDMCDAFALAKLGEFVMTHPGEAISEQMFTYEENAAFIEKARQYNQENFV